MHGRTVAFLVAACGMAARLGAQAPIPIDSGAPAASAPVGFFRLEATKALSDTAAFTTSVGGNYAYGRNDNAYVRWGNTLVIQAHKRLVTSVRSEYLIGIATNDSGGRYMDRRRWSINGNMDLDPTRRLTPFLLAAVESNIELKIVRRTSAGVGAKVTLYRWAPAPAKDGGRARQLPSDNNRLDASLAILAENNALPPGAGSVPSGTTPQNLTRVSWRFRWSHRVSDRVFLDHTTWYKPEALALHRYLAELRTSLHYALTSRTKLTLTSFHSYDGSASRRGARSNRAGSLDAGVTVNLGKSLK